VFQRQSKNVLEKLLIKIVITIIAVRLSHSMEELNHTHVLKKKQFCPVIISSTSQRFRNKNGCTGIKVCTISSRENKVIGKSCVVTKRHCKKQLRRTCSSKKVKNCQLKKCCNYEKKKRKMV